MKKLIVIVFGAMTLGGCVVVPAYEPAGVYVYPSPPHYHGYYRHHGRW